MPGTKKNLLLASAPNHAIYNDMRIGSQFRFRPLTWVLSSVLAALLVLYAIGCLFIGAPGYDGPPSDHFDGTRFFNSSDLPKRGFLDLLKWSLTKEPGAWLEWSETPPGPPPPERVSGSRMRVTLVGHATALIQMDGLNILTDPVWSDRIGPFSWLGPKRRTPPGIRFEDLPPIDAVIISHDHYDQLDVPTLRRLATKGAPRIFAGLGTKAVLDRAGVPNAHDMDWWDEAKLSDGVALSFVPAQHFSGRGLCDRGKVLWGGFVIRGPAGVVYFAGDTGMGPHFAQITRKYGPPRLALLPIGAFLPRWFMKPVHISPEEAVEVHRLMGARTSIPLHYGTFRLGDDGQFDGVGRLVKEIIRTRTPPASFPVVPFGTGYDVP